MKNKLIKLLVLALVILPVNLYAREDVYTGDIPDIPKSISIREVGLDKDNFIAGDTVTGKIKIYSNEDEIISGYKLSFELRKIDPKDTITADRIYQARILNIYHGSKELVIKSNTETIENFEYKIPKVLPEGDYYLRVLIRNPESSIISEEVVPLGSLSNANNINKPFVDLTKNILEKKSDKSEWSLNMGITINQQDEVVVKGEAILEGEQQNLLVYPKLVVYERAAGEKIIYESKNLASISLQKGKAQVFEIPVPKLANAGGYFAELVLEKDYQAISNIVDFHWVVGGESGRIINLTLNKTNFEKDEEAIIDMQLADRADLQFSTGDIQSLGEVKVITTLNCDKNYTKTAENLVNLNDKRALEVKIPIDKKVDNCTVKADLLKNDKQLHSKTLAYKSEAENQENIKSENNSNTVIYTGVIGLILIIMLGLVFMKRKNIFSKLFIMLGFVLLSSFSYQNAFAGPCSALDLNITDPKPNLKASPYEYKYGENIALEGDVKVTYCTNYPAGVKLAVYLDGDDEPFYIRDYSVPSKYGSMYSPGTNALKFGTPTLPKEAFTPDWHTIEMKWFQDCTLQGSGTASGSMTRSFYVKPPEPSLRISQEKVQISVGEKFKYQVWYDSDGPEGSDSELEVTSSAIWTIQKGKTNIKSIGFGEVEGLIKGNSEIEAEYLGKKVSSDIEIRDSLSPYVIVNITGKNKLIYPQTTKLQAKLVEFPGGVKTETLVDGSFTVVKWEELQTPEIFEITKNLDNTSNVKGVSNSTGIRQIRVMVQKNKTSPIFYAYSPPIEVTSPTFKITPSIFAINSDATSDTDVQFNSLYDSDGLGGGSGLDVTKATTWSSGKSAILSLGEGKFRIPKKYNSFGIVDIEGKYTNSIGAKFDAKATLDILSMGSPLSANISILSVKGREVTAYIKAEGGKPLYTYTNHKVIDSESKTDDPIPLDSSDISSNGVEYKFKVKTGITVPKKIKIQAEVSDTGGASTVAIKEFIYLGEGLIREVNL